MGNGTSNFAACASCCPANKAHWKWKFKCCCLPPAYDWSIIQLTSSHACDSSFFSDQKVLEIHGKHDFLRCLVAHAVLSRLTGENNFSWHHCALNVSVVNYFVK